MGVNVGVADPFVSPNPAGFEPQPESPMLRSLSGECSGADPSCRKCTLDGASMDCHRVLRVMEMGAAVRCPNDDCGARAQTVTARGQDGRVITTSYLVTEGQAGWDGSLDGTYLVNGGYTARYNVGAAGSFADFIATGPSLYGDSFYSELVQKVSGGDAFSYTQVASWGARFGLQDTPKRVPLSGVTADLFKLNRNYLLSLLNDPESDCAKFLSETFGFSAGRVARAVRSIRAFDADASTISMGAAGLTPYRKPDGGRNPYALVPVNEYFTRLREGGIFVKAMQAGYSMRTMRDVYFSYSTSFKPEEILHEVLHMFTGGDDAALAIRLGVNVRGGDTEAINEALKKGGCRL